MEKVKVGTWNFRGLVRKETELVKELEERNVNICVLLETKKKLRETQKIGNFTMIYAGVEMNRRATSGVEIMLSC